MKDNIINFTLKPDTIENLQAYREILNKDINMILEEALEGYFAEVQKRLLEKNISDENAMTNLDYDEFWEGVEL